MPRFIVQDKIGKYYVVDDEAKIVVNEFIEQSLAEKEAIRLNEKKYKDPISIKRTWHVAVEDDTINTREALLNLGYEPFGVSNNKVYFRLKIR